MSAFLVLRWLSLLVDVSVKSVGLLTAAGLFHVFLRRASAAARHLVWLLAIGSVLGLPLLSATLPEWRVSIWPRLLPAVPAISPEATRRPRLCRPASPHSLPALVRVTLLSPSLTLAPAASLLPRVALIQGPRHQRRTLPPPLGIFLIWLTGAGAVLAQVLVGAAHVRWLERRCRRVTEGPLAMLAGDLGRVLGLRRPVTLLKSRPDTGPIIPMTWGWRRPRVLLPADCETWPASRLRSVLLHELAHVQRQDWPAQLLTCLTGALYWFHPLVWLAARQLRIESERACDDRVLTAGVRATDYASHLLEIVRSMHGSERSPRLALTMVPKSPIELRVRAILERQHDRRQAPRWAAVPASLIVLGAVIALAAVRPGDNPSTRRGSTQTVLISLAPRRVNGGHRARSHTGILVAIMERSDHPLLLRRPIKKQPAKASRALMRERPASPREQHLPRPESPAAPRPPSRPRSPSRLLAALPESNDSPAVVPPSPPTGAEPTPTPEPERPEAAPAARAMLVNFEEPPASATGDSDRDTAGPTLTLAVQEDPQPSQARKRWGTVLLASQTASPTATQAAEGPDQTTEPQELEPDTDVLPVTGQDREALTAPSDTAAAAAQPSTPGAEPLGESDPRAVRVVQIVRDADGTILATELRVWDRTRQSWDRVLLVWNRALASPATTAEEPEEEWMPEADPGATVSEPGSLDEELWFWDRMFEHWDQEHAGDKRAAERGQQGPPCPPCLPAAA